LVERELAVGSAARRLARRDVGELEEPGLRIAAERHEPELRPQREAAVRRRARRVADLGDRRGPGRARLGAGARALLEPFRERESLLDAPAVRGREAVDESGARVAELLERADEVGELAEPPAIVLAREVRQAPAEHLVLEPGHALARLREPVAAVRP